MLRGLDALVLYQYGVVRGTRGGDFAEDGDISIVVLLVQLALLSRVSDVRGGCPE